MKTITMGYDDYQDELEGARNGAETKIIDRLIMNSRKYPGKGIAMTAYYHELPSRQKQLLELHNSVSSCRIEKDNHYAICGDIERINDVETAEKFLRESNQPRGGLLF